MNLFEDLKWRGIIYDITSEELIDKLNNEKLTFYLGIDPTAESVHIGTLFGLINVLRLKKYGHKPIILLGGATGMIGDPKLSGERVLLDTEVLKKNLELQKNELERLVPAEYVNNYDWLKDINILSFLRDIGKNFNINEMLSKDIVKKRLETGLSFTEFSYQILQAYDFKYLYEKKNCTLQVGGQDQWGNITAGIDYIRKTLGPDVKVYGLTWPLLIKEDGTKFGKSEKGTIWLNKDTTSPYEFYQFWINTPDSEVIKYLKWFTFLEKEKIEELEKDLKTRPEERIAQKVLAEEVTSFVHGKSAAESAIKISEALFQGYIKDLTLEEIEMAFLDVPSTTVSETLNLAELLVNCGASSSKREAREFISNNAVMVNGELVNDLDFIVKKENAIQRKYTVIRRGKKNYYLVKHK
jgi:tyrosyl-tRNA synthetase